MAKFRIVKEIAAPVEVCFERARDIDSHTQSFAHDHRSEAHGGGTVMVDEVEFRSPFGPLGRVVDAVFTTGY